MRKIYQDLQDKIPEIVDLKIKDEWVSVTEAARIIGVDKGTVSRWANERLIADNVETGRNRRIRLTSVLLLKYMREQNARQKDVDDILQDIEKENPQYALKSL
ncbi:MAG TPA: helix-turn-helix domain-containing protein [Planctomycetes bacterium]|nr:helix-turn-helix domain-containing protein [Planctomycetota bacterium]